MNRSTKDVKTNRNKPKSEENKSTNEITWEPDPPGASLISTDTSFPSIYYLFCLSPLIVLTKLAIAKLL